MDVDDPGDTWGAGENCTFAVAAGLHVSRLASLGSGPSVSLDPSMLQDGPWCPDETRPARFDADLLRVRRIRVVVRVQAAAPALRGPVGALFAHGGTALSPARYVPDQEIRFDVSPRNPGTAR